MVYRLFILILLFVSSLLTAQKPAVGANPFAGIDRLMLKNNARFTSLDSLSSFVRLTFRKDEEKARAIFYWITSSISYATDLMYTYQYEPDNSRLASLSFENRKAVCSGYAALADTLCRMSGLESFIVGGSTRQSFFPTVVGHAWNAVKCDGQWKLMDVTWGSGFLNGRNFVRRREEKYFLPDPARLARTHLPFDPIWQMSSQPLNLYQFNTGGKGSGEPWNWQDSITVFLRSPELVQIKDQLRRLKWSGTESEATSGYYRFLQSKETLFYNREAQKSNLAYNTAVTQFNDYVNYRNKQFQPERSDEEIGQMLKPVEAGLLEAGAGYGRIVRGCPDRDFVAQVENNLKMVRDLQSRVKEESDFVDKYLATKKNKRRNLFYTRTYSWFGIPIK